MECCVSITEAFEQYRLDHIVYMNQAKRTEEMSKWARDSLISQVGDIPIEQLTFDMIRKWKESMEKDKSANTVRGYVIKLRVVLKYLHARGYQGIVNPKLVGVPKRKSVVVEFVSPEDVMLLIDTVYEPAAGYSTLNRYRNRAMISLLYASGIRVSELCSLDTATLQADTMSFTVIGKGDKPRLCFFDTRTKHYLQSYLDKRTDSNEALFISEATGKRISKCTVQMVFRNATKKAGFSYPIHPHTMRHSFATNLLKNNTNLMYVRDFLGHSSVQTTEMYTHVVHEDLRRIYKEKHTI